jgi:hypothetical protein
MKKTVAALLIAGACALTGSTVVRAEEASALSAPTIPDWTAWKCDKVHVSHKIIETYECHGPEEIQTSRIILKVKGAEKPFLIGWGYDEKAPDAGANTHAALYKDGKWIVGARGTGFTTEERGDSITFYIFLDKGFSAREQIDIHIPETEKESGSVAQITPA